MKMLNFRSSRQIATVSKNVFFSGWSNTSIQSFPIVNGLSGRQTSTPRNNIVSVYTRMQSTLSASYGSNLIVRNKASIQKPAPAFHAEALVDGQFSKIALKDYLGK